MLDTRSSKYAESHRALIGPLIGLERSSNDDWLAGHSTTGHALSIIGYLQVQLVGRVHRLSRM